MKIDNGRSGVPIEGYSPLASEIFLSSLLTRHSLAPSFHTIL